MGSSALSDLTGDLGVDEVYIRVKQREEMHLWPLKEDLADWLNTILGKTSITIESRNFLIIQNRPIMS